MGVTNVVVSIPLDCGADSALDRHQYALDRQHGPDHRHHQLAVDRAGRARAGKQPAHPAHVDIARLSGAGTLSLILSEILPYMLSYICLAFVLQLASGILQEAALSLLGLGISQGISLGIMLHWALLWESVRTGAWWAFVPPTLLLAAISFGLLMLQTSLDEVFNPRLRRG